MFSVECVSEDQVGPLSSSGRQGERLTEQPNRVPGKPGAFPAFPPRLGRGPRLGGQLLQPQQGLRWGALARFTATHLPAAAGGHRASAYRDQPESQTGVSPLKQGAGQVGTRDAGGCHSARDWLRLAHCFTQRARKDGTKWYLDA